ncbi:SDR family NAD(P)-dependent oxidoreductase [Xanthobacter sp. KR7-225]|uniref:SDR family NAD(P)-dependent oxidoreductase n=1 Tax=Xanthobacter sp. KR7-225 TaxID=3156613 RepID=UPI0032B52194
MRFENKIVIVTGAARGLAAAAARMLAKEGASLVLADLDMDRLKKVAADINASSPENSQAVAVKVDVTSPLMIDGMVKKALERNGRIDAIVNCAGGYHHYNGLISTSEQEWNSIVDTNLKSIFLCCQAVLPTMVKQNYGRIVNVSSLAARTYSYFLGSHYSAAKAGTLGLTRHIAHEYGPKGVTANAIAPTAFRGERLSEIMSPEQERDLISKTPLRRIPDAEDIAPAIVFLASDEARFITGVTLDVNGGLVTH